MMAMRALLLCLALAAGTAAAAETDAAAQAPAPVAAQTAPTGVSAAPAVQHPSPVPAAAPAAAGSAPSSAGSLLQVVFGLLVVLGLLAGALYFLRRMGGRFAPGSVVKIVGGVSVGNRERVMVVEVADQWIVIGVAPGQVSTLASMPRQDHPATQSAPGAPNFSAWLKQTIEKRNAN
jgi:flagellar protein FliO/FliZ